MPPIEVNRFAEAVEAGYSAQAAKVKQEEVVEPDEGCRLVVGRAPPGLGMVVDLPPEWEKLRPLAMLQESPDQTRSTPLEGGKVAYFPMLFGCSCKHT